MIDGGRDRLTLFSFTTVPTDELEREQGIAGPQGLSALIARELADGEDIDRYLTTILEGCACDSPVHARGRAAPS